MDLSMQGIVNIRNKNQLGGKKKKKEIQKNNVFYL